MRITLPAEAQAIIEREIESGRYATQTDVIVDALKHLEDERGAYDPMRDPILLKSLAQAERGDGRPLTRDVMDELAARARENARAGKPIRDDVTY